MYYFFYEQIFNNIKVFLTLQYFRLSCMYWPNSVQQGKPSFLPAPTMTPNYNENPTFCNPVMTSNNITNEHHMPG